MKPAMAPAKARPKYYDLNLAHLPAPGLLSIFHRVTGLVLFFVAIPVVLLALQQTLQSQAGWDHWKSLLATPLAKLVVLGFVWSFLHHFFAGIRYLLLDVHVGIALAPARTSARIVIAAALVGTLLAGVWIW